MKKTFRNISRRATGLLAAGLLSALVVNAADPPPPGPPDRPRGDRPPPPDRGNFQGRGGGGGIGLDEQQRELYRDATQKNSDELRKLDEKLRAAQKELVQAVLAEKYDEKTVREKAEAVAKIQTDITLLRAKALSTVAPTLKPEQRDQLENSRLGAAMLTGGGFGGPDGFRGGQPGQDRPPRRNGDQPRRRTPGQ